MAADDIERRCVALKPHAYGVAEKMNSKRFDVAFGPGGCGLVESNF